MNDASTLITATGGNVWNQKCGCGTSHLKFAPPPGRGATKPLTSVYNHTRTKTYPRVPIQGDLLGESATVLAL